jgi:hypothetical protein
VFSLVARSGRRALAPLLITAGLGAGLVGCGGGSGRAVPVPVTDAAPSGGDSVATGPTVTAPVGAHLAIGTADGMEVWSASTGVFTVGPPGRNVVTSDLAWSADGEYLSWQTLAKGGGHQVPGSHGDELWYAALRTGVTDHWGPLPPGRTYGPVVVTDTGVLTLGPVIRRYSPVGKADGSSATGSGAGSSGAGSSGVGSSGPGVAAGGVSVGAPAGPVPSASRVAAWLHGWVVEPSGPPAGQRIRRLSAAGATIPPEIVLGAVPADVRLDLESADAGGQEVAAELGHQRTGCELTGNASLWVASLTRGTARSSTPPTTVKGARQRFWAVDVSGPSGSVFASTFDCATKGKNRGRATSTVLWNFQAGTWHRVGAGLVAADQLGHGPVATLAGQIKITRGVAAVTGVGAVRVGGLVVATGGQAIAWSPAVAGTAS